MEQPQSHGNKAIPGLSVHSSEFCTQKNYHPLTKRIFNVRWEIEKEMCRNFISCLALARPERWSWCCAPRPYGMDVAYGCRSGSARHATSNLGRNGLRWTGRSLTMGAPAQTLVSWPDISHNVERGLGIC